MKKKKVLENEVRKLLENVIIEHPSSDYASPQFNTKTN